MSPRRAAVAAPVLAAALLCACATSDAPVALPKVPQDGSHFNVNGHLGYRNVRGSGWKDAEDQPVGGASVDYTPPRWPIGFEGAVFGSYHYEERTGTDFYDSIFDMSAGLHSDLRLFGSAHLYLGAGVTTIFADRMAELGGHHVHDDDGSFAWYGRVGTYWRIKNRFNVGVEGRTTQNSEMELFGGEADADHWQVTVFFGWGW